MQSHEGFSWGVSKIRNFDIDLQNILLLFQRYMQATTKEQLLPFKKEHYIIPLPKII